MSRNIETCATASNRLLTPRKKKSTHAIGSCFIIVRRISSGKSSNVAGKRSFCLNYDFDARCFTEMFLFE